jgi:membrane protease YdiL (CAAX protease family)
LSHLAVFIILIVMPIISYFEVKKLKLRISDQTKEFAYSRIYGGYILMVALIVFAVPFDRIWTPSTSFAVPTLLNYILWSLVSYQLFMLIVPTIMVYSNQRMRAAVAEEYKKKDYMFPRSRKSLIMFSVLAFIVGISEEIIFRGFLYTYLQDWGVYAVLSFIIVNIIFGLAHYHQGKSAVWDTMLLGFCLGQLYISSGSLFLPIIFHILYDLKIVFIKHRIMKDII